MKITYKIVMDLLDNHPYIAPVDVVQNDSNTRVIEMTLFEGNILWDIPEAVTAAVAFVKPDGTRGLYDQLPDGTGAVTVSGNTVTAILAPQVMTAAGEVKAAIVMNDANLNQLATFPFTINVARNPAAGKPVSNDYYKYTTMEAVNKAIGYLEQLQTNDKSNLVAAINEVLKTGGNSGSGSLNAAGFEVNDEEPNNKSVLWVDTSDNSSSDDEQVEKAVNAFFEKAPTTSEVSSTRRNLYNPNASGLKSGYRLNKTTVGEAPTYTNENSAAFVTEPIPVKAGESYVIQYIHAYTYTINEDRAVVVDENGLIMQVSTVTMNSLADGFFYWDSSTKQFAYKMDIIADGYLMASGSSAFGNYMISEGDTLAEYTDYVNESTEYSYKFTEDAEEKIKAVVGAPYYIATNYGISTASDDNTYALQKLVRKVNLYGGGVIYLPSGTYNFDTSSGSVKGTYVGTGATKCCIRMESNVSIIGESLTETVLKVTGNSAQGVALFGFKNADNPLTGCTFSNFTIDASEATIDAYSSDGKAFFFQYVKDCVFRDLRLIGTPATAMGNDFLDNVVMDSIYVYNAGRLHADDSPGGAGIGIGTGGFDNENFIVRNCICDSCGHFGIFTEDQAMFAGGAKAPNYSKGMIIANNIVRNGRNYGIGLRGSLYASVAGNNIYSNANGGIYLDYAAESSAIMNNIICDEVNAICFGNEHPYHQTCNNIVVSGNTIIGCTNDVVKTVEPTNSVIENNVTIA